MVIKISKYRSIAQYMNKSIVFGSQICKIFYSRNYFYEIYDFLKFIWQFFQDFSNNKQTVNFFQKKNVINNKYIIVQSFSFNIGFLNFKIDFHRQKMYNSQAIFIEKLNLS